MQTVLKSKRPLTREERKRRDREDAEAWALAAKDPEYIRETQEIEQAFGSADRETWPPE